MYGNGEPSETPLEPGGANQASTSGSSGEALSKQIYDNPVFAGNATASTSQDEKHSPDETDGEARINPSLGGPSYIPLQSDAGWVPLAFSPIMSPGNPGPFGISPIGTADGVTIPQCIPMLFPVQLPYFLPSPSFNQAGQNVGIYPFSPVAPFYGIPEIAVGAPAEVKFPIFMSVPMPMESDLPNAAAGPQVADARRTPLGVGRGEVPLGRVGPVQLNEGPPVAQAGAPDQRQVVRRFQVDIQLDLLLLLKLAVIVFVFNQDGSKDRLFFLLGLACVIYLYQTNSLAPLLRWITERAQQFMTPPQHRAQAQPDRQRAPDGQAREAPVAEAVNPAAEEPTAEAVAEAHAQRANARTTQGSILALVREVQILVVGFITSLLPGFHPHAD